MKKKILIIITYLNTGGILRSLESFLNCYDKSQFDVDVFALVHFGVYKNELKNCYLLPRNRILEASIAHLENRHKWSKLESIVFKLLDKITNYRFQKLLFRVIGQSIIKAHHYESVIGFSEGLPMLFVSKMDHPNKIGWIHCDYANYLEIGKVKSEEEYYKAFNSIVCVSEHTRDSFVRIYPSLKDKTYVIYNILDNKSISKQAYEPIPKPFEKDFFNIVSVGRIDPVKRMSVIPELARKVLHAGCRIRWYVIGPKGTDAEFKLFLNNINKYGVAEFVLPLGEASNPYPYIKKADLLVNTSISEACPYVINEAKILGTPVVCTNFGSAKEFIEYGINGYYEPIDKLAERISWLINNPNELNSLRESLSVFKYDNTKIIRQIYSLL